MAVMANDFPACRSNVHGTAPKRNRVTFSDKVEIVDIPAIPRPTPMHAVGRLGNLGHSDWQRVASPSLSGSGLNVNHNNDPFDYFQDLHTDVFTNVSTKPASFPELQTGHARGVDHTGNIATVNEIRVLCNQLWEDTSPCLSDNLSTPVNGNKSQWFKDQCSPISSDHSSCSGGWMRACHSPSHSSEDIWTRASDNDDFNIGSVSSQRFRGQDASPLSSFDGDDNSLSFSKSNTLPGLGGNRFNRRNSNFPQRCSSEYFNRAGNDVKNCSTIKGKVSIEQTARLPPFYKEVSQDLPASVASLLFDSMAMWADDEDDF